MPQKCAYDTLYESRCRCAASKQARTLRPGRATCPSTLAETVTSVAANKDTKDVWVGGLLSGWSTVCFQASMWESPCLQANRAGSSSSWTTQDHTGRAGRTGLAAWQMTCFRFLNCFIFPPAHFPFLYYLAHLSCAKCGHYVARTSCHMFTLCAFVWVLQAGPSLKWNNQKKKRTNTNHRHAFKSDWRALSLDNGKYPLTGLSRLSFATHR